MMEWEYSESSPITKTHRRTIPPFAPSRLRIDDRKQARNARTSAKYLLIRIRLSFRRPAPAFRVLWELTALREHGRRMTSNRASEQNPLEQMLESAVVLSWKDLIDSSDGRIQIEFRASTTGSVEYVKVWASGTTRGHWSLVCESHGVAPSAPGRTDFSNGFHSGFLAQTLEYVLANPGQFLPRQNGFTGLVQVQSPTEDEIASATECVRDARKKTRKDSIVSSREGRRTFGGYYATTET